MRPLESLREALRLERMAEKLTEGIVLGHLKLAIDYLEAAIEELEDEE